MWLGLESLTESAESFGLSLLPSEGQPSRPGRLPRCRLRCFLGVFVVMALSGLSLPRMAYFEGSPQSDPIGHVYPSCLPPVLLPWVPRTVTRCRPFCCTAGCPWDPLQGQGFGSRTSPIPALPRPPPPMWQPPSVWQSKGFFPVGRFLGAIGTIREGRRCTWYVSVSQTYLVPWEHFSVRQCGCHRPLCLRTCVAVSTSVVSGDVCFLVRSSVHGHRMCFLALLLGRGLPEPSGGV